jgi:hypothetical protein
MAIAIAELRRGVAAANDDDVPVMRSSDLLSAADKQQLAALSSRNRSCLSRLYCNVSRPQCIVITVILGLIMLFVVFHSVKDCMYLKIATAAPLWLLFQEMADLSFAFHMTKNRHDKRL